MQLTVKGRQLDVGQALRGHVEDSLNAVAAKYFTNPIEATVVFSREAHLYRSDVSVHVGRNILLQSNAAADSPYGAFDQAADRVAKRLRRYKRRLKDHHKNGPKDEPWQAIVSVWSGTTADGLSGFSESAARKGFVAAVRPVPEERHGRAIFIGRRAEELVRAVSAEFLSGGI